MNDDSLKHIPEELLTEHLELSERLAELQKKETIQTNFLPFVKTMWSDFIEGEHHRIMARAFDRIASGELKRLIINMRIFMGRTCNKFLLVSDCGTKTDAGWRQSAVGADRPSFLKA